MGNQGWLTRQACACRSAQHLRRGLAPQGGQEGDCARVQGWSGMRSSHLPCCPCQVPRPLAMKKESIQTRKRKPKNPAKIKGSSGVKGEGGHSQASESVTLPLMGVLQLVGEGTHDVSRPKHGTEVG